MGNVHSLALRLTALSMACLASAGFIFCALAGFGCNFVQINAKQGRVVLPPWEEETIVSNNNIQEVAYIGVQCERTSFYDDSDQFWNLSQIFFYTSMTFGGLTTLLAWSLGLCLSPTVWSWRILSILAAITAVVQVPIFLIFESDSCTYDVSRQTCALATGAYLNIVSIAVWALMTIWTQCLKPPQWHQELDAWRIVTHIHHDKNSTEATSSPAATESAMTEEGSAQREFQFRTAGFADRETYQQASPEILWASMRSLSNARHDFRRRDEEMDDVRCSDSDTTADEQDAKPAAAVAAAAAAEPTGGLMGMARLASKMLFKKDSSPRGNNGSGASGTCGVFESTSRPGELSGYTGDAGNDGIIEDAANVMESIRDQSAGCKIPEIPRIEVCRSGDSSQDAVAGVPTMTKGSIQRTGTPPGLKISCIYSDGTRQHASFPAMPSCMASDDVKESLRAIPGIIGGEDYDQDTTDVNYLVRRLRSEESAAAKQRIRQAPFESIVVDRSVGDDSEVDEYDRTDDVSEMTRGSGLLSGVSEVLDSSDGRNDPMTILEDLARTY